MALLRLFPGLERRTAAAMPLLALLLGLLWPALAHADNDWLGIEVPRPFDEGAFSVNVRLADTENVGWQDGSYFNSPYTILNDGAGNKDIQDLVTIDTRFDWRMEPRLVLELDVPTVFSEFSPIPEPLGTVEYYSVNTPTVEESQGLGDLRLGLRGALKDKAEGFNAGWNLSLVAPTGLSPFDAPQTLAATGDGRWQALPGFVVGGQSDTWEGWWQVGGCLQFGQQAESSGEDYLSWRPDGGIAPAQGGLWLGPRYGADSVVGLAWIWYRDTDTRVALALEGKAHWLSPWTTGAGSLGLSPQEYVDLTPELQVRYGRYSAVVGWQTAYLWAMEEPSSNMGNILFDVAYTF
jgi:hypothetical protein